MKTITKTILYLQMTALLLTTALAAPNTKEKDFRGSIRSIETSVVQFPTRFVDGSGTGQAPHLGPFTYTFEFVVDLPTGIGVGSAEFTVANGDRLFTTVAGLGGPSGTPGFNHVVEEQTIVGGTGRFAGASGSFTLDRLINLPTGVSEGTVDGTIVLQGINFKGTLQQVESHVVQFPIVSAEASASGNATHLGRYTMTSEFEVNLLTLTGSGFADFIAANGDALFTAVTGQASPTDNPNVLFIVETFTVTGGTGRFAGATGSFTGERLLDTVTNISSGSLDGTVVLH